MPSHQTKITQPIAKVNPAPIKKVEVKKEEDDEIEYVCTVFNVKKMKEIQQRIEGYKSSMQSGKMGKAKITRKDGDHLIKKVMSREEEMEQRECSLHFEKVLQDRLAKTKEEYATHCLMEQTSKLTLQ